MSKFDYTTKVKIPRKYKKEEQTYYYAYQKNQIYQYKPIINIIYISIKTFGQRRIEH